MIEIKKLVVGPYEENCFVLLFHETGESLIVDPGAEAEKILDAVQGTRTKMIVITHGHPDHVGALEKVRVALDVPVAFHPGDADAIPCSADVKLADGDHLTFGSVRLQVIHTPGHTPGSICLYGESELIAGDTIFPGGPGRTDTPERFGQIVQTLREKIFALPPDTRIHPGHGLGASVGSESPQFEAFLRRPRPASLCGDVTWN